jgi:hypothetical protein
MRKIKRAVAADEKKRSEETDYCGEQEVRKEWDLGERGRERARLSEHTSNHNASNLYGLTLVPRQERK